MGLQCIVNYLLFHNAFSIGIEDTIADKVTMLAVNTKISEQKEEVRDLIQQAQKDQLKPSAGATIRESFEGGVEFELFDAKIIPVDLKNENNVKYMVVTGSEGSFINISEASVCIGQQSVEGRRISLGFRHRTLPHFTKCDFSPEARGFSSESVPLSCFLSCVLTSPFPYSLFNS